MSFLLLCAILLEAAVSLRAQEQPAAPSKCIICDKSPLTGKVWRHPQLGLICDDCNNLEARCWVCKLPAKDNFIKTGDGRIICRREAASALLKEDEATAIFQNTVVELAQMSGEALALQQTNISSKLFDIDYWNYQDGKPLPTAMRRTGFSQSRKIGDRWTHNIILLSGQTKEESGPVCAHEYTHLWINENRPAERKIEFETVEAVCELVAFKLAVHRNDEDQQKKIKENPYTRGRILTLIEAEARFGLNTILEWVRNGTEETVTDSELVRLRVPSTAASRMTSAPVRTFIVPAAPEKLTLRGLVGSGTRRLALINGTPFAKGEEAKLKLASGQVKVKCVDILEKSVIITVDGGQPITLELN